MAWGFINIVTPAQMLTYNLLWSQDFPVIKLVNINKNYQYIYSGHYFLNTYNKHPKDRQSVNAIKEFKWWYPSPSQDDDK